MHFPKRLTQASLLIILTASQFSIHSRAASSNDFQVVDANDDAERRPDDPPEKDVVILVADPAKRAPLEHSGSASGGEYRFSPDARWLYGSYHLGSGMGAGEMFAHRDGPRFTALDGKKRFSDLAWEFCFKQGATTPVKPDDADVQIIDFVAWSPDAARVLVSLRGGARHGDGIYAWHVYWNTRLRAFELTDYLRALNRTADRRWTDDTFRENSALATCAEPLPGGWPTLAKSKEKYAAADQQLNTVYAAKLRRLSPKEQKAERNAQRQWLKRRDEGAGVYAGFGADAAEKEIRRLQHLAGVTRQRIAEYQPGVEGDE